MSYKFPPDEIFYEEFEEPLLKSFDQRSRSASLEDCSRFPNKLNNNSIGGHSSSHSELASCSPRIISIEQNDQNSVKRVPLSMTKRGKLVRDFSIQEDEDQDSIIPNVSLQPYQKPVHKPIGTEHTSVNNQESNYDILGTPNKHRSRFCHTQHSFDLGNLENSRKSSADSAIQCDISDPPSRNGNNSWFSRLSQLGRSFEEGHRQILSSNYKATSWQKSKQLSLDLGPTRIVEDPQVVNQEEEEEIDETELAERIYKKLKKRIKKEKSSFSFDSSDSGMDMPQATNKYFWKELLFGHRIRRWVFWSVVAFLSALTLKDVYDLVAEYNEDPKQADMKIVFNKSIAMPNITFCMSRTQAWSHFHINGSEAVEEWDESIKDKLAALPDKNTFLNTKWDFRMTLEAYEVISTLTSIERETSTGGLIRSINRFRVKKSLATKRRLIKFWISEIKRRGVSFEELIQKVGKETLDNSIRKFERIANDTEKVITNLRISWLSTTQLCFQPWFNHKSFKPIEDQGSFFTMITEHSVNKLEGMQVDCMSVDFHGRPSSLSRFMESEGRIRDGYNDELCLGMMHEVKVEIRARYQMLENNDDGTACRNNEGSINSEFNCRSRCRMELLREVCRCTALSLSYLVNEHELDKYPLCDYETCFATLNGANFSETNCSKNCFPDCNQIRYDVDHKVKGRSAKSDPYPGFTSINIRWGSFEYLMMEQHWVWSATTFIAALGGAIGMWLGLSILSLIQGGTYIYAFLTDTVIQKKIPIKRSASIKRSLYKAKKILTVGSSSSEDMRISETNSNSRKFSILSLKTGQS